MKIDEFIEKKCSCCLMYNEFCWHYENLGDISESAIEKIHKNMSLILNFEQFVNSPLYENNNNLPYDTFKHQLKKMGFKYRLGAGSRIIWDIPFNGSVHAFTTHLAKNAKADSIRILLNKLKEIGWLDVPENAKKVPWDSWQVKPKKYGL